MKETNSRNTISPSFIAKKNAILQQLAVPVDQYTDLSPKNGVDAEIIDFVNEINSYESLVTTSSCSGRISVFLEGQKSYIAQKLKLSKDEQQEPDVVEKSRRVASQGGKGGGGRWLFVSHAPLSLSLKRGDPDDGVQHASDLLQMFELEPKPANSVMPPIDLTGSRLIHFKFEPMILHILAANIPTAQRVLSLALQSGFRESGASSIQESTSSTTSHPIPLAIRTTGLSFDNIIGFATDSEATTEQSQDGAALQTHNYALVSEEYLSMLVNVATEKFRVNSERTEKFRAVLAKEFGQGHGNGANHDANGAGSNWEDKDARRARKREEGLRRKEARLLATRREEAFIEVDEDTLGVFEREET